MRGEATPNTPAVHLWNPIVGTELLASIGGGQVEVHLPISLAVGVAAECSVSDASTFLELIVRAALPHIGLAVECPDLHDDIAPVLERFVRDAGKRLEVTMEAKLDPANALVRVVAASAIEPIVLPTFPNIERRPGFSSWRDDLWEPHRFVDELPMVVSARAGGRPGWSVRRGVDIRGVGRALDPFKPGTFDGWPQVVIVGADEVVRLDAQWDVRNRATGELIVVRLQSCSAASHRHLSAPEWSVGDRSRPAASPESDVRVLSEGDDDREDALVLFDTPRVVVTAGKNVLLQLGDDVWSLSGPRADERFDDLLAAMDALEELVTSTTRLDYHDSLEELQDEADFDDREHLFSDSPDGFWKVGGVSGIWVPARAEDNHEDVFTEIGVYGKHGYFVHLFRWNKQYLYYYDNGWEDRKVGWEVLGTMTRKDAISAARAEARVLWAATGLTDDDVAEYEEGF